MKNITQKHTKSTAYFRGEYRDMWRKLLRNCAL